MDQHFPRNKIIASRDTEFSENEIQELITQDAKVWSLLAARYILVDVMTVLASFKDIVDLTA